MNLTANGNGWLVPSLAGTKPWLVMRLTFILLTIACLQVAANGYSQQLSVSYKNTPLEAVFKDITAKTGYLFFYASDKLKQSQKVTLEKQNTELKEVLEECFKDQPYTFQIIEKTIVVKYRQVQQDTTSAIDVQGVVTNDKGLPVAGATIRVKGLLLATTTDVNGQFVLRNIEPTAVLIISGAELTQQEVSVNGNTRLSIKVQAKIGELDQVLIQAYGETTRRFSTGSISKVTAEEISKQPVSNPLLTLQGRVPGLVITQQNGYAGGAVTIQIRGQNSILQGSSPLFVINGVPYAPEGNALNQVSNAATNGLNPFYLINPGDIESIEVLKDASATSIYGSRGANGVILITTKKGKAGKTAVNAQAYSGISKISRSMKMMNTEQYLTMRKEAFLNDGITPTTSTAADLLLWDSTRHTDIKKLLIGNTAHTFDAQVSVSGGSQTTKFLIGSSYHRESTVLPTNLADNRTSLLLNVNHVSNNRKLEINMDVNYAYLNNNLPASDLTGFINRPPNLKLYDSLGNLNWQEGGVAFRSILGVDANPLAVLNTKYAGDFQNLTGNLVIGYKVLPALKVKVSVGYNTVNGNETRIHPSNSIDPYSSNTLPSAYFASSTTKRWIVEPQVEYEKKIGQGKLSLLLGSTVEERKAEGMSVRGADYSSDLLLYSISGAGSIGSVNNSLSLYRYNAFFGRLHFNWQDKYITDISARRDGSSRFGPESRFNNAGAIGIAWIFSKEGFIQHSLPSLSYGKLRASYGITGNDQISNYLFSDTWTTSSDTYQQIAALLPNRLFNPNLAWETNKKLEVALDLGMLNDRLLFSVAYFQNRCGNQLVNYDLPLQTGFQNINRNLNATIRNTGTEFTLQTRNITTPDLTWTSAVNLTIARNKLMAFPGLETSAYATQYVIGEPLSIQKLYRSMGLDPATGMYRFEDADKDGQLTIEDRIVLKDVQPEFYGGFRNTFRYKGLELDVFFQFVKQQGLNYLYRLSATTMPGYRYKNQPVIALNRWQKEGDVTDIQKYTTIQTGSINQSAYLTISDAMYSDASFIRCKNISLSYDLPASWTKAISADQVRAFVQVQNPFVITNYVGADPENQNVYALPPLRTFTAGIKLNF